MSTIEATPTAARTAQAKTCQHCGAPTPSAADFCCAGCAYVFRLVHETGLDAYYHIKDTVTAPADVALLPARDHDWLVAAQRDAETRATDGQTPALVVNVQGISCAGCVWLIEKIFTRQRGAGRIEVNAQTGQLRMQWMRDTFRADLLAAELQRFNYLLGPAFSLAPVASESRSLAKRTGLCAAFAMNVMLFTLPGYLGMEQTFAYASLFAMLAMLFATLTLLAGGGYFLARAWRALREGAIHIDLPIALGIVGAYLGSTYGWLAGRVEYVYFDFVSAFILLMLIGRWAQTAAIERNQRRLLAQQPAPQTLHAFDDQGQAVAIAPAAIAIRQRYTLSAGQTASVESRLESERAAFSLAWITGEAEPRTFQRGQRVPAGAQNLAREAITLVAEQTWEHSLLAELLTPATREVFHHRLLERVIQGYLLAIIGTALLAGIWWGVTTHDFARTGAVVVAVLVVSCPCALGLAFPLCDEIAAVTLRRRGVFVRAADLWPRLARVRQLVFDKTGTLTLEHPHLLNPEALYALSAEARRALHVLVRDTPHPICRALHEHLQADGTGEMAGGDVREIVGEGVKCGPWRLGRAAWATDGALAAGETVFARDGEPLAQFQFRDALRADARTEVAALIRQGFDIFILSGDRRDKVAALGNELGLPASHIVAECSPHHKAAWLAKHAPDATLMLGDGANDSLAFDQVLCRGTPVVHRGVLEKKADFYYLGRGIAGIRALFDVDRARSRTQRLLLVFMILYNCAAVSLAVTGHMNPLFAAILMPVSSLLTLALVGWGMRSAWR